MLKLFDEVAGLPKGAVNGVTGFGDTGAELVRHPDVDKVAFTGSTRTGKSIMAAAAETLKHVSLECGGKSPNIVFADAPMPKALDGAVWGIFRNSGQVCTAGSRLLVQEAIYDDFVSALLERTARIKVGEGFDGDAQIGPLISEEQMARVLEYIEVGKAEGARLLCGGGRITTGPLAKGYFVEPTVFGEVDGRMRIAQEEIFGPVLSVFRFRDDEEAVSIANDVPYGLAAAVWTQDLNRAMQVSERIKAGTVWLNTYHLLHPEHPFGGYKQSGLGRELGRHGLEEYLEAKHVCLDSSDVFDISRDRGRKSGK